VAWRRPAEDPCGASVGSSDFRVRAPAGYSSTAPQKRVRSVGVRADAPDRKDRRHADRAEQRTKQCKHQVAQKHAEADDYDAERRQGVEA
jgi:hypothetical protein